MTEKAVKEKPKVSRRVFTAPEKCQAVLSIWSERRKPHDICRELGINWAMLDQWQQRAMEGMMEALAPKKPQDAEKGPSLGPRLEKLLERAVRQRNKTSKLAKRLETIQAGNASPSERVSNRKEE